LKGVPLRVEIGIRDVAAGAVTLARRDTGEKQQIALARVAVSTEEMLRDVQASLFQAARDEQERRTLRGSSDYTEMIEYLRDARGFVVASWCGRAECELRVKRESSATIRCLSLTEHPARAPTCICCGRTAVADAVWAQAY
jgi:prolyl-tRNA synthetase